MSFRDNKITINKKLRPIRLAFLVRKDDNRTLREVFRINTCLYNPIIPFFKKTPPNWEDRRFRHPPASSIIKGYLDSFDPDYLVVKNRQETADALFDKERILSFDEVINIKDDRPISYGVDVTDLYWHLYEKDFKFERRHPIKVFCPIPSPELSLVSACTFGDFPDQKEMQYVKKNYCHCFNAKDLAIEQSNFVECFLNEGVSPLRITRSENDWHLRTIGPFSVENYAQGGYCVALSLEFFGGHGLSNEMTWIPSFTLKTKKESPLEADFGIFLSEGRIDEIKSPLVIFGECKSFSEFTTKDVNRMGRLADQFPGAIITFCTLRKTLTVRERKIIATLARRGRKHLKAEQWINPVLVLTGIELFDMLEPPSCWKDKGAPYQKFAEDWRAADGIKNLCDATQQMHLGIESYWDWYEQKRQKRLARRKSLSS